MNLQRIEEQIRPMVRVQQIVIFALTMGCGLFLAIVLAISRDEKPPFDVPLVTYVAAGMAVATAGARLFVPNAIVAAFRRQWAFRWIPAAAEVTNGGMSTARAFPNRLLISTLLLGVMRMALAGALAHAEPPAAPRNIVVFLTDDQGQLDSTPYGGYGIRTPNMQRLANAGLTFERAYVASPSCAPSRAALLTGLMPARNGAEANHSKPRADLKKWPACFQELGYEVVAFGKVSHYRHTADYGFDHFAHDTFHDHAAIPAAVKFLEERSAGNECRSQAGPRGTDVPNCEECRGASVPKPLCLMVGSNWPHVPWPEKDLGYQPDELPLPAGSIDTPAARQWRAQYAAAVTKADDDLGAILDAVQKHLGPETLIVFSSDHGAQWPFGKWNLYESGVRVPLVVSWPGVIKPGTRTAAMVNWTDLLPTLVEAAGGKPPDDLDGRSFLDVLRGKEHQHRDRIFTTHSGDGRMNVYPIRALRAGDWKYIRNLHPEYAFTTHIDLPTRLSQRAFFATWEAAAQTDPSARAILKRYHARPAEELYNLAADPHEQHNLASEPAHAERLAALRAELDAWLAEQGDKLIVFAEPRLLSDPNRYGAGAAKQAGQ
jgi:arylsulfatase A-like enzyme